MIIHCLKHSVVRLLLFVECLGQLVGFLLEHGLSLNLGIDSFETASQLFVQQELALADYAHFAAGALHLVLKDLVFDGRKEIAAIVQLCHWRARSARLAVLEEVPSLLQAILTLSKATELAEAHLLGVAEVLIARQTAFLLDSTLGGSP